MMSQAAQRIEKERFVRSLADDEGLFFQYVYANFNNYFNFNNNVKGTSALFLLHWVREQLMRRYALAT